MLTSLLKTSGRREVTGSSETFPTHGMFGRCSGATKCCGFYQFQSELKQMGCGSSHWPAQRSIQDESAVSPPASFFFLATPCSTWDLSSPTRGWTHAPCSGSAVLTTGPPGKSSPPASWRALSSQLARKRELRWGVQVSLPDSPDSQILSEGCGSKHKLCPRGVRWPKKLRFLKAFIEENDHGNLFFFFFKGRI